MEPYEFGVKTVDPQLAKLWADEIKQMGCEKLAS